MNVRTLLEEREIQIVCTLLEYGRPACREALVASLDSFLRSYMTANGANDTETCDIKGNPEALDNTLMEWLKRRENGMHFWPSIEGVYPFILRYNRDREL